MPVKRDISSLVACLAGSEMLKSLAIGVMGELTLSVLFSLMAISTLYFFMRTLVRRKGS